MRLALLPRLVRRGGNRSARTLCVAPRLFVTKITNALNAQTAAKHAAACACAHFYFRGLSQSLSYTKTFTSKNAQFLHSDELMISETQYI